MDGKGCQLCGCWHGYEWYVLGVAMSAMLLVCLCVVCCWCGYKWYVVGLAMSGMLLCGYEWYVVGVAVSGMLLVWLRDGGLLALARLCGIRLIVLLF